jgi:hypothetical protein
MPIAADSKMRASDMTDLVFFPVGTILLYCPPKGTVWKNDKTLPGWYLCDGTHGTPDLRNKFIRGATAAGAVGGQNDIIIDADYLPAHKHTAAGFQMEEAGEHNHYFPVSSGGFTFNKTASHNQLTFSDGLFGAAGTDAGRNGTCVTSSYLSPSGAIYYQNEGAHTHSLSAVAISEYGKTADKLRPVNIQPAYYTVIFIMKG